MSRTDRVKLWMAEERMAPELDARSIIKANSQFWEQMLAMKLEPIPIEDGWSIEGGHFRGAVEIGGAWSGCIELHMAGSLAFNATAAMLMQPVKEVTSIDALDAVREIANMIAGVIKSSLPRGSLMQLPESSIEDQQVSARTRPTDALVVGFRHITGDLIIRVSERSEG